MGGAETIVLTLTGMLFGPLLAPTIWGLLSGRIGTRTVFVTAGASFAVGVIVRLGMASGLFAGTLPAQWIQANPRLTDVLVGAVLPVLILSLAHVTATQPAPQWQRVQARLQAYAPTPMTTTDANDHAPVRTVAISLTVTGLLTLGLIAFNDSGRIALLVFGAVLLLIAAVAWQRVRRRLRAQGAG